MSETADKIIKILDIIDKAIKPITSVLAVVKDDHRIRTVARIPRETTNLAKALFDLFEEE